MNRKKMLCCSLVLCTVLALSGCGNKQEKAKSAIIPKVQAITVGQSKIGQGNEYPGEVRGRYESKLAFQVGGRIIRRNIQLGSAVGVGDVLMEIDSKDVAQSVTQATAGVDSAQSRLELAESDLRRYGELLAGGAISQAQYDQYRNAYKLAVAAVKQNEANYVQSANQLGYTQLRVNEPGVVAVLNAEIGQVVSAGQVVAVVVQDGEREVEINVPENRVEEIVNAPRLRVTFWALEGLVLDGRVREVAPMADPNTRTFKVRVALDKVPDSLRLGMTATVVLAGDSRAVITVPQSAVYQTGDKPAVWVVEDNTAKLREVEIKQQGKDYYEISKGLSKGETVIIKGVHKLENGQQVKVGGEGE